MDFPEALTVLHILLVHSTLTVHLLILDVTCNFHHNARLCIITVVFQKLFRLRICRNYNFWTV